MEKENKNKEVSDLLNQIDKTEKRLLKGVFDDLYGSGSNSGIDLLDEKGEAKTDTSGIVKSEAGKPEPGKSQTSGSKQDKPTLSGNETSLDDILKNANDALKEARELFDALPSLGARKGTLEGTNEEKTRDKSGEKSEKKGEKSGEKSEKDDIADSKKETDREEAQNTGGGSIEEPAEAKKEKEPEEDPMEQLDKLIGLTTIKHDVKELIDFVKVQKQRSEGGLKSVPVSLHLVFTGNPGTGKTTVARLLAKLYKQIGVLSEGQLIEVDRSGLVAGYVGQTALKTQEKIKEAMGGVLFIDEAYSLAQKDDAFGQEAIDTILKAMEDHRDNFVVIVAGYTKPMEKFINSNPGLKSRFNKYIEFPDYTVDELEQIFNMNCKKYDYTVEEDAAAAIREMIKSRMISRRENFANAREVRNLFEEIITNQARRVAKMEAPSSEDMMKITTYDLLDEEVKGEESSKEKALEGAVACDNEVEKKIASESPEKREDISEEVKEKKE